VRHTFTATGGGNFVRAWCTAAPPGSKLRKLLDDTGATRVVVYSGDSGNAWVTEWDKGGAYSIVAQEYTRGAATTGGGYSESPSNAPSETKIGTESSLTIYVSDRVEIPVGFGKHTATLLLFVNSDTIRATSIANHGVLSPELINPSGDGARIATQDTTVRTKLAALADVAAATVCNELYLVIDDFKTRFDAHRVLTAGSVHAASDADNSLIKVIANIKSSDALIDAVNECRSKFERHARNDSGGGTNSATSVYHAASGPAPDGKNLLVKGGAGDTAQARAAMADLHRAYEAHRAQTSAPAAHGAVDSANALLALPALLQLDSAFAAAVASATPTAPATSNSGAVVLVARSGGKVI
jgi:hypothetical protein